MCIRRDGPVGAVDDGMISARQCRISDGACGVDACTSAVIHDPGAVGILPDQAYGTDQERRARMAARSFSAL